MTMTNWTPESLKAESEYRRVQLHRLAAHRTSHADRIDARTTADPPKARTAHWWTRLRRSGSGGTQAA
ncbi:MAG TPA: hypothetical protein VG756_24290 [Pseudonocardiaceae bacterium]|jgi:hypothetical protein|nr:hypothetical protein [Pseudonocardiaceae bacterium]